MSARPVIADNFPAINPLLIKELERRFPDRCPDPAMTDREVWMAVGAAQVVRVLRQAMERQNPLNTK